MIFVYYVLLSVGQALAEQGIVPAIVGLWLPNAIFAALGAFLFARAARERTLVQLQRLQDAMAVLRARLLGLLGAEAS